MESEGDFSLFEAFSKCTIQHSDVRQDLVWELRGPHGYGRGGDSSHDSTGTFGNVRIPLMFFQHSPPALSLTPIPAKRHSVVSVLLISAPSLML